MGNWSLRTSVWACVALCCIGVALLPLGAFTGSILVVELGVSAVLVSLIGITALYFYRRGQ